MKNYFKKNLYILGSRVKPFTPEKLRVLAGNLLERFFPVRTKILNIDIAGCNLRCSMCPRGGLLGTENNKKGFMNMTLFKKIIKKVMDEKYGFELLQFGNWGESLLNPLFPEMVRYAKSQLGSIKISVNTNLTCLPDPTAVIKSGLDMMSISVSGMTQSVYSRNHVGGNIDIVLTNLKKLIYYKRKFHSKIELTLFFHDYIYNKKDADLARKFCQENGIQFFLNRCFISSLDANINFHKNKRKYASVYRRFLNLKEEEFRMRTLDNFKQCRIRHIIPVDFDGMLYRCCGVYDERKRLGSLFDFKIKDIENMDSEICKICAKTPISWR